MFLRLKKYVWLGGAVQILESNKRNISEPDHTVVYGYAFACDKNTFAENLRLWYNNLDFAPRKTC